MRALRLIVVFWLLVALPLAGGAAGYDCCPPGTMPGHPAQAVAGSDLHHAHDSHQPLVADLSDDDCSSQWCALHCAHAPTVTSLLALLPVQTTLRQSFPVPPDHAALAAAPPNFRPPIAAHC